MTEPEKEKKLTAKERMFVEYFLGESFFNATDAARRAGYKHPNVQGPRMLVKVSIRNAIKERIEEAAMTANEVLARLTAQGRGNIADVLTEAGEFDLAEAKRRGTIGLVKKFKTRKTVRMNGTNPPVEEVFHELELYDAQAALVHLGKYHKLFADKVEVTGKDGAPLEAAKVVLVPATLDKDSWSQLAQSQPKQE